MNILCRLFGHKLIVALSGPNWYQVICTRCGDTKQSTNRTIQ